MSSKFSTKIPYYTDSKTLICEVERKDCVYILSLVNKDNRLRPDTILTLLTTLGDIENDFMQLRSDAKKNNQPSPTAALITIGLHHIYSNGLDLSIIFNKQIPSLDFFENYYHKLCLRMFHMPMPTIAAINGHAFAGGMPEVDLPGALTPGMMSIVTSIVCDYPTRRDVLLQGKKYTGDEALQCGMIDQIVTTPEALLPASMNLAKKWATKVAKNPIIYMQLRLEMRAETIQALNFGGLGFIPKI